MLDLTEKLRETESFISSRWSPPFPGLAVILGSGLGALGDALENRKTLSTEEIPRWPRSTVSGHSGKLIRGELEGVDLLVVQGRAHFYEGYTIRDVAFPVQVLARLGVETLIITNASGAVNPSFEPGDLMLITDHINMMFQNPLIGPHKPEYGPRFPDMSRPYDPGLLDLARKAAGDLDIRLREGILLATLGPSYETRAEIRMMKILGADAACMSTVPEVIAAKQRGMKILGISCITNMGTGLAGDTLTHEDVEETAGRAAEALNRLLRRVILRIAERG